MFWYVLQTIVLGYTSYLVSKVVPEVHITQIFVFSWIVAFLVTDLLSSIFSGLRKLFTSRAVLTRGSSARLHKRPD